MVDASLLAIQPNPRDYANYGSLNFTDTLGTHNQYKLCACVVVRMCGLNLLCQQLIMTIHTWWDAAAAAGGDGNGSTDWDY